SFAARFGVTRRLIGRRLEMPVPASAAPSFSDDDALAGLVEVRQANAVPGVVHDRPGRDGNDQVRAGLAVHLLAHAGFAARGVPMVLAHEIQERVLIGIGDEDDVAAVAPVAAVGAALGDVFLAPEGDASGAAVARFDVNGGFVDEHRAPDCNEKPTAQPWALSNVDFAVRAYAG